MQKDSPKYRLLFFVTVFLICIINVYLITFSSPEVSVIPDSAKEGNELQSKKGQIPELKTDDLISTSSGLKVETVEVSSPVSFDTVGNLLSIPDHLIKLYLRKKYSLLSHNNLFISKRLNLSHLITKLQI